MEVNSKSGPQQAQQAMLAAQTRARAEAEKRTREVERRAKERMELAEKQATQVEHEMESRIEKAREDTDTRLDFESTKRQAAVGKLRNETYSDLAELKRRTSAEMAKLRAESERKLEDTEAQFEDQIELAEYDGRQELRETQTRNARLLAYQNQAAENEREILKKSHQEEMKALDSGYRAQRDGLQSQGDADIAQIREKSASGRKSAEKHFEGTYSSTVRTNSEALGRANLEAQKQLDQLRGDHAQKLAAYETRLEDPFYRMVDLGSRVRDHGEYYTVEARVPEHEREHLKVTVRGGSVMISGARRNEENLKLEDGGTRKVASFQTYQESLPLEWPVDAQGMLQEFDGDRLVVTLPKKGSFVDPKTGEKRPLEREPYVAARAPRPDFPAGIPGPAPRRTDKPMG